MRKQIYKSQKAIRVVSYVEPETARRIEKISAMENLTCAEILRRAIHLYLGQKTDTMHSDLGDAR